MWYNIVRLVGVVVFANPTRFHRIFTNKRIDMLPQISKEVVASVQKSMSQKDYLHESWTEMMLENTQLFQTVTTLIKSFPDKQNKESFLRGAWLVWALFKSQDQANDMNEEWGI